MDQLAVTACIAQQEVMSDLKGAVMHACSCKFPSQILLPQTSKLEEWHHRLTFLSALPRKVPVVFMRNSLTSTKAPLN